MGLPRTFVGFSGTDTNYYRTMQMWKAHGHIEFDFCDCQLQSAVNSTDEGYIKRRCRERLEMAGTYILLIVTYKEMAKRLGVDPGTVRRLVDRHGPQLGISVQKGRSNTTNAKWTHYITREDADRLAAFYETLHTRADVASDAEPFQRQGFFYVIQLVPEVLPNRIKIGYTDNLDKRLTEHQTAAPTAKVIASWPCKRSWDYAAMDSITREGCSLVLNEVFEGDPEGFTQRGNDFFSRMPKPDSERVLSEHSPLRQGDSSDEEDAT